MYILSYMAAIKVVNCFIFNKCLNIEYINKIKVYSVTLYVHNFICWYKLSDMMRGVMSRLQEKSVYLKIRLKVYSPFMKEGYCAAGDGTERNG